MIQLLSIINEIKNKPALIDDRFASELISGFLEYVKNTKENSTHKKSPKKTRISFISLLRVKLLWKIKSFFRN